MELFDNVKKFVNSPQGMAMAQALLANSGYSTRPITLGEAMGQGLLGVQQANQREFDNKHKDSLLGLKKEGLENQKMSTQAYIDNMKQQQAMAYQRLKMLMDERSEQRQAMQNMQNLIGTPETYVEGPQTYSEVPIPFVNAGEKIPNPREQIPQGTGAGFLGGKINQDELRQHMAKSLLGMGDVRGAMGMLEPPKAPTGKPMTVMMNGEPTLVRFDGAGRPVPVEGVQPMPSKGMEVTTPDGTTVRMGGSANIGTVAKNTAEKGIMKAESLRKNIRESMKNYNPEYLQAKGKIKDSVIDAKNFVGIPLTEKEKDFGGKQVNFEHMVGRGFHEYMQLMVGARPAVKLYEYMLKSYPNMRLRPNKFEHAMKSIDQSLKDTIELNKRYLKQGFSEDEAWQKASEKLDEGFQKIFQDIEGSAEMKKAFESENDPLGLRR